jgi:hypothetical protein
MKIPDPYEGRYRRSPLYWIAIAVILIFVVLATPEIRQLLLSWLR